MQRGQGPGDGHSAKKRNLVRGPGSLASKSFLSAILGFVLFFSLVRFLPQPVHGTYVAVQVSVGVAGS